MQMSAAETQKATYSHSNPRVRKVASNEWQVSRMEQFRENVRFAAAAKSYRTAMGVTQREVGKALGMQGHCIAARESGCYFGWTALALKQFTRAVNRVAASR